VNPDRGKLVACIPYIETTTRFSHAVPSREEIGPMKIGKLLSLALAGIAALAGSAAARPPEGKPQTATEARQDIVLARRSPAQASGTPQTADRLVRTQPGILQKNSALASQYSVEIPAISRVQGHAFFRTAVDISNNTTNGGVVARLQYSYTCLACAAGGFFRTQPTNIPLGGLDNFHSDDMVDYLNSLGLLVADAENGSFGTLLILFQNLPSSAGWEGTAVARTYSRLVEADPAQGTIGSAYPASLFFESAHQTLVVTLRDTSPAALANGTQGSQRSNLAVRNTDINPPANSQDRHVSVQVTFYDTTPGSPTYHQKVGLTLALNSLLPGEVRQFSNIYSLAQIPGNISSAIAFVDVVDPVPFENANGGTPTIEGYVNVTDNQTQDTSFFEMKCGDDPAAFVCGQ
jgi:hypothetical protein